MDQVKWLEGMTRVYDVTMKVQSDDPEIVLVNLQSGVVALFENEERASIYLLGRDGKEWMIFKRCREAETKFEVLELRRAMYEFGRTKGSNDAESQEESSVKDQASGREAESAPGASVEGA